MLRRPGFLVFTCGQVPERLSCTHRPAPAMDISRAHGPLPPTTLAGKAAHWAYKERPAGAPPPPPIPAGDLAAASTSSSDEGEGAELEHLGVEAGHPLLHIKGAAGEGLIRLHERSLQCLLKALACSKHCLLKALAFSKHWLRKALAASSQQELAHLLLQTLHTTLLLACKPAVMQAGGCGTPWSCTAKWAGATCCARSAMRHAQHRMHGRRRQKSTGEWVGWAVLSSLV